MSLGLLKANYNKTLAREKAAEEYFKRKDVSTEDKNKWMPKFMNLIVALSKMINEYKSIAGKEMSKEEVLEGFKEG